MTRYFETSKEFGSGITFDIQKEFGDIELFGTLMQFKSMQKEFWESVGNGGSITASPLIYGGAIYFGAHDKRFYCLDMDGNEKWHYDTDGNIMKWAVEGGGLVYFGSFDGAVYALDTNGKLAWKFETQGPVLDNPIFHDGRVYCGSGDGNMYCINAKTGKEIWKFTTGDLQTTPLLYRNRLFFGYADNTFYCLDMNGKLEWQKDFGKMSIRMQFGEGSSPVLHGDKIVINWDHEGQSFITALDKKTGKKVWKVERDERTSWATPLVVEVHGKAQVISSATNRVRSYALASGKQIWECRGMTGNVIPTPVYADDIVYLTSGFRGSALLAIRLSAAKGNITGSDAVIWRYGKYTPYAPSPLLQGGKLYMLKRNDGYLSCLEAATGKEHYVNQRLEGIGTVYASLVGARDRLYVVGKNGTTLVVRDGPQYRVLSRNVLKDKFTASPAIAGKELYLRGHKYLYCIARE